MNLPAFAEEVGFLVQKGQVSWIVAPFGEVVRIKLRLSVWLEFFADFRLFLVIYLFWSVFDDFE